MLENHLQKYNNSLVAKLRNYFNLVIIDFAKIGPKLN